MKKFILNTCKFVIPFLTLYTINVFNFDQREAEGDLARMGYFYSNPSPRSTIDNKYNLPKQYTLLSEISWTTKIKFDVLTIGDSFSEQDSLGYKNFLGNMGVSVVHTDRFISGSNPIQTLVELINADFFDYIQPEYIVVQSIERDFNDRTKNIDFNKSIHLESLSDKVKDHKSEPPNFNLQFFSDATLKMPLNNFQYLYTDKPLFSNTYKVKSTCPDLFSNNPDNLLFYKHDIKKLGTKNNSLMTLNSIKVLNKIAKLLSEKNIELIVVVSPDKFDLYYPYIENKADYVKPTFFQTYEMAEKEYKNVDTYRVLSRKLTEEKDVYYYDDTHWSPKGAKFVAEEIYKFMKK